MSAIPDHARIDTRAQFARTATALLDEHDDTALVYAEISGQFLEEAARRHPHRVVNVGIREQLMINVAAGMAMTGLRPIAHTFGSFLVERAFEQSSWASATRTSPVCWWGPAAPTTSPRGAARTRPRATSP